VSRAAATAGEPTARKSPGTTVVANRVVARDPAHRSALSTPTTPPTDSPASWVLLAATRRELGPGRLTYSPEIGVVNGVITGTNQVSSTLSGGPPLTYSVVGAPSGGGKVTVEAKTGNFTYLAYSSGLNPDGTQQFSQSEQFKVLIAETTPLDAALERIPLLGDLVQPILVRIHQVPVLRVVLAPLIGRSEIVPVTVNDAALADENGAPIAFTTTVISFDHTPISVNYFPAGYNVVTWDPRGEFASGGVLHLDSPEYEAKDVSAIITWVSGQPETAFDPGTTVSPGQAFDSNSPTANNPLIGMVGGSYGGGIQLTSAGTDKRIDAIVPGIAWNSLNTALYPQHGFKTSFASLLLLSLVVSGSRIDPEIYSGILTGAILGFLTPGQQRFLADASPDNVVGNIDIPSLFMQGTVDVLFPLQQAIDNAEAVQQQNVPVKMIWYCGGHGQCLDPVNLDEQTAFLAQETLAWINAYVRDKGDMPAPSDGLPTFQWVDQEGNLYSSNYLPTEGSQLYAGSTPITVSRNGTFVLPIAPLVGGSGPQNQAAFPVSLATGSRAIVAVNVAVPASTSEAPTYIVGAPTVTLTYSGLGTSRNMYAQLVDNSTGRVVGNILTPIPVVLDGGTRTVSVPMEDIAYTMEPGDSLTLQIVGTATPFENLTSFGIVDISRVDLTLPTANPEAVTFEQSFTSDQAPEPAPGLLGI
jgi:ABC-2 type transport system ATP-binding protein